MNVSALIFFLAFGLIITGMYIALRRQLFNPTITVSVGMVASTIAMILTLMQNNPDIMSLQAIFFGFLISLIFSGATLAMAWYFQTNELREHYPQHDSEAGD